MSPEQARGQVVDKRTDIWAFGCVLYEMLAGRAAFKGGSVSDTIAAVLGSEPDWDALPNGTPTAVRLLLQRCLEKDPKRRLRDLGDVHFDIDDLRGAATTRGRQSSRARRALAAAVVTLVLLTGGAALFYFAETPGRRDFAIGIYPAHELQRLSECAQPVSRRADGHLQTRRRLVPGIRPDLRQAAAEWRVGTADVVSKPKVRTGIHSGRHTSRLYGRRRRGSGTPGLCRCSAASRCGSYPTPPGSPGLGTIRCCSPKSSPASTWGS